MIRIARRCIHYFVYDMKMYNKFVLIYFIFTIFPFLFFSVNITHAVSGKIFRLEVDSARAVIDQADKLLCNQLQNIIEETYTIYLDNDLYEYLSSDISGDNLYQTHLLESKLSTIVESGKALNASLYLTDSSKISRQHYRCQSLDSARHMSWYQMMEKSGQRSLWHFTGTVGYYVSSIYNKYNSKDLIGYVVITFSQNRFLDILDDMCITQNSEAFLTDKNQEIVLHARGSGNSEQVDKILAISEKENHGSYHVVENKETDQTYILIQEAIENKHISGMPRWVLSIALPYHEVTSIVKQILGMLILSAGVCIILICFVTSRIIGSITRRIDKLNRNMQRPQKGDFSVNDMAPGCDEISELRRNFNFMLEMIEQLLEEKTQADAHQKDLELNMLQAQINPHFLYNTLDMINWVAISRTPEEVPVITSMLAKFYKLSLNRGARIVRLMDEMEHVRLYIGIQNKRYDSALTLKEQIPEEYMDCASMKILLQPIVENAVLHGIFEKDIPEGTITVSARLEKEETLAVEIMDDGAGIAKERLEKLKQHIYLADTDGSGYGLSNIEERIKLCYGNGFGLEFESVTGAYTKVTVRIRYVKYDSSFKMSKKLVDTADGDIGGAASSKMNVSVH